MTAFHRLLAEEVRSAKTYPSSTGRQLLQYYYDPYYGNGNYWSGGRIAGVVVGAVFFVLAILFLIIAITLRRRRRGSYQANSAYPAGTYPAAPTYNQTYPQAYPQANQYPQASTYPNQAYPQNTEGYNPAPYNSGAGYPNTATGTPANGQNYNGVQMSALPHEKPGY